MRKLTLQRSIRPGWQQTARSWFGALSLATAMLFGLQAHAQVAVYSFPDRAIAAVIQAKLERDPLVRSYGITVDSDNGVVTLRGRVDNLLAEERAVQLASDTESVRGVVNRLTVNLGERTDKDIYMSIQRHIASTDSGIRRYDIQYLVENQIVTLRGNVPSLEGWRAVQQLIMSIKGVKWVENELLVQGKPVDVTDRAVPGPVPFIKVETPQSTIEAPPTDTELRDTVQAAIRSGTALDLSQVTIQVREGIVILRGVVPDLDARNEVEEIVQAVPGVDHLLNLLRARTAAAPSDATIAERIRQAYAESAKINAEQVAVSVVQGTVYLSGIIDSPRTRALAEQIAREISGVREVENALRLEQQEPTSTSDPGQPRGVRQQQEFRKPPTEVPTPPQGARTPNPYPAPSAPAE